MVPPDVEPIAQQRSDRRLGVTLLLFGAFGAGGIGYLLGLLTGWGAL